ncbi:Hypothetical predicted protein [Mytilus galloprovincialis]|uniref:Uncharacterized protein n=1 Tax=Mytilus galloprovincialis TaxID=29158 RepID=A0A8B6EYK8_MYTGA|nr:Hypothetical predicted protein [Mytilus galloprovincialis]
MVVKRLLFVLIVLVCVSKVRSSCVSHTRCMKLSSTYLKCDFPGMCVRIPAFIRKVLCVSGTIVEATKRQGLQLHGCKELHHKEEEEEEEEEKKKQLFVKPEDRVALIPFRGETGIEERPRKNTDTPLDTPCPPTTGGFMDVLDKLLSCLGGVLLTLVIWYVKWRVVRRKRRTRRRKEVYGTPLHTMRRCISSPNVNF